MHIMYYLYLKSGRGKPQPTLESCIKEICDDDYVKFGILFEMITNSYSFLVITTSIDSLKSFSLI